MKSVTRVLAIALVVIAAAGGAAGGAASAAAQVAAGDAQEFLGQWNLTIQADGPVTLGIDIRDDAGQVAASVAIQGSSSAVETITKSGENLMLQYVANIEGQQMPISIELAPNGNDLRASLDVASGMFTTSGTARRR
jgi:hypothetical protein